MSSTCGPYEHMNSPIFKNIFKWCISLPLFLLSKEHTVVGLKTRKEITETNPCWGCAQCNNVLVYFFEMGAERYIVCFNIPLFCNILTTILRPNFEEPLNTAKQMVENNITMFGYPGAYHPDIFNSSNDPYYKASHQNQKRNTML